MTTITIRGNITAPPELRFTQNGRAVASVTVAENTGKDDQKRTHFHRVTLWAELAEHAATLDKGTSVIVVGRLEQREYETREGEKRQTWEVTADAFGPDLRFQTVNVTRASSDRPAQAPADGAWAVPAAQDSWGGAGDDSPF